VSKDNKRNYLLEKSAFEKYTNAAEDFINKTEKLDSL